MKPLLLFLGLLALFAGFAVYYAHKDDAQLRAECEARGGTFIHATEPLHVCVTEPEKGNGS